MDIHPYVLSDAPCDHTLPVKQIPIGIIAVIGGPYSILLFFRFPSIFACVQESSFVIIKDARSGFSQKENMDREEGAF